MKACCYLLASWLAASSWAASAIASPVVFARSSAKVTIPLVRSDIKAAEPLVVFAYGRRWDVPMTIKNGTVEFTAPQVRVPVVFQLLAGPDAKTYHAALVVYPDRPIPWDKDIQLVAVGSPGWFDQWLEAVGAPATKFEDPASLRAGHWRALDKRALLVIERQRAAGPGLDQIERLAAEQQTNVLVLEAEWFGASQTPKQPVDIVPKQMAGPLADWRNQQWARAPSFRRYTLPWLDMSNRQTWIAGPEYPLVEEIRSRRKDAESLRIILSYLPWEEQLGRCEMADSLFLRVLTEAASGAKGRRPLDGRWCLLWPVVKDVKAGVRPVLAAAMKSAEVGVGVESPRMHGYVLDLRGGASRPSNFLDRSGIIKRVEAGISERSPLVILGDDPALDAWKWLKLDRAGRRVPRPGVVWWPDRSLPPSIVSQMHLMQLFTEWNILLEDIPRR